MKLLLLLISEIILSIIPISGQQSNQQIKIDTINKKICDFDEKNCDLTTPLKASVKYCYAFAKGEYTKILDMSSPRVRDYKPRVDDESKRDNYQNSSIINSTILEVINYHDSVACVIRKEADDLILHLLTHQNGRWLDEGEDIASNLQKAKNKFLERRVPFYLNTIRKIAILNQVSTDTLAFINYLHRNSIQPKEYLLKKLATHKLVAYGELHGRKNSWDLMRSLIASPDFPEHVATIFLELSVDSQNDFDRFLDNETKEPEIILDILRKESLMGWSDKGMFEFILDLWEINHQLPKNKKIRIIPVDTSRPFYNPNVTKDEYDDYHRIKASFRDFGMANNIEQQIKDMSDNRNCLFIVGYMHAYHSPTETIHTNRVPDRRNCISILSDKLPSNSTFSIIAHGPIINNNGIIRGLTRKGLFDYVFTAEGNVPVAFDLKNSPFGKEPIEVVDNRYDIKMGSYGDCYDGYIFLQSLKDEESRYFLPELMTKAFFEEIHRRANIVGAEEYIMYSNVKIKDAKYEDYILYLEKEKTKRWKFAP
ncbi:hypothetical protein [uncultured Bacteroides sp.]|uniref:hypothetical protein n=1 Tax=uncultured Bacteroides sp. TaxID=162156 RepID=UPI002AABBA2F|nr:hypothetical protein [uncultured Bacteroides sp.]